MSSRVLIIDDDASTLEIVDAIFAERGFDVQRCSDGAAAVEQIESSPPDVVIVDLMMPAMAGRECVLEMRRRGLSAPIVAFTALEDPQVHYEAERAGCTKVIVKPCKSRDLISQIENLLIKKEPTS